MDFKFCTDCGTKNVLTAKFCFGCGLCFAALGDCTVAKQTASAPAPTPPKAQPPVSKKQKQVYVFESEENENLEDTDENTGEGKMVIEVDQEFANDFANIIINKFGGTPRQGIKIEEVVNTAKPSENRKVLGRRKNTEQVPFEEIVAVEVRGQAAQPARPTRQNRRK